MDGWRLQLVLTRFSDQNIRDIFDEFIQYSPSTGIDGMNVSNYRKTLSTEAEEIEKRVLSGKYKFSIFKQKLISKGADSNPRIISIPTIRDKIVLKILANILFDSFKSDLNIALAQDVIRDIKSECKNFDSYLKIDVRKFFDSIVHVELEKRYWKRIRNRKVLNLLYSAVRTGTGLSNKTTTVNSIGVPQGLSISNFLAELYMYNFDNKLRSEKDIKYYRYVDDILIFYNKKITAPSTIFNIIKKELKSKLKLQIHELNENGSKSQHGDIKSFSYLGYQFKESEIVTARSASVQKLYNSLVSIFISYVRSQKRSDYRRRQSEGFLLWRLNLRVTGCIFEQKKRGWLFFFSEINDEKLLHQLDSYIEKLKRRFKIKLENKKYVKSYKELTCNIKKTTYIPNFDEYTLEQKKEVLSDYFSVNTNKPDEVIDFLFKKRLGKQVADLLVDIGSFS